MSKVRDAELPKIAKLYNDEGREATYEFIISRGIKYPDAVLKRMRNHPKFDYDKETDTFLFHEKAHTDDVFMTMEELCSPLIAKQDSHKSDERSKSMEKLIQELLGDRLLELSKYIILEASSRTMIIDLTSLKGAGYKIVTH